MRCAEALLAPSTPLHRSQPTCPKEALADAVEYFEEFARYLEGAIDATDAHTANNWLHQMLGDRFPYAPHRMKSNPEGMPASMAAIAPAIAGAC